MKFLLEEVMFGTFAKGRIISAVCIVPRSAPTQVSAKIF